MDGATVPRANLFGVSPVLPVPDVAAAVDYYADRLGFKREPLWGDPPTHGSVNRGRVGIQFTRASRDHVAGSFPGAVYLFVDDAEAYAQELLANGVVPEEPVEEKPYGMIEFAVRDLNGYRLVVGQYTS